MKKAAAILILSACSATPAYLGEECDFRDEYNKFCLDLPDEPSLTVETIEGPDFSLYDVRNGDAYLLRIYEGFAAQTPSRELDSTAITIGGVRARRSEWRTDGLYHVLLERAEAHLGHSQLHLMVPTDLDPENARLADDLVAKITLLPRS